MVDPAVVPFEPGPGLIPAAPGAPFAPATPLMPARPTGSPMPPEPAVPPGPASPAAPPSADGRRQRPRVASQGRAAEGIGIEDGRGGGGDIEVAASGVAAVARPAGAAAVAAVAAIAPVAPVAARPPRGAAESVGVAGTVVAARATFAAEAPHAPAAAEAPLVARAAVVAAAADRFARGEGTLDEGERAVGEVNAAAESRSAVAAGAARKLPLLPSGVAAPRAAIPALAAGAGETGKHGEMRTIGAASAPVAAVQEEA